jgi:hypothetical protein
MLNCKRVEAVGALVALSVLLITAGPVFAYGGPGVGVEFFGYFLSLVIFVVGCFVSILLWPFYALMRKIRGHKNPARSESVSLDNPAQSESTRPQSPAPPAEAARVGE